MALVPATITVNFTSNYTGNHRVCYRLGGVGPYDCTTIVTCLGGGTPCSTTINVIVDDESCNDYVYDGYVQAVCETEDSPLGIVAWTATYTPTNACFSVAFTCNASGGAAFCPAFTLPSDPDCGGGTVDVPAIPNGDTFSFCFPAGTTFTAPTDYTRVPGDTDCCTCNTITISAPTNPATTGTYFYQDCITKQFVSGTLTTGDPNVVVCSIISSEGVEYNKSMSIVIGGTCPVL